MAPSRKKKGPLPHVSLQQISRLAKKPTLASHRTYNQASKQETDSIFSDTVHAIHELVESHQGKMEKKQYRDTRLRALGFKPPKSQRMPLPELQSRRRSAQRHLQHKKKLETELGVQLVTGHAARDVWHATQLKKRNTQKQNARKQEKQLLSLDSKKVIERNGMVIYKNK